MWLKGRGISKVPASMYADPMPRPDRIVKVSFVVSDKILGSDVEFSDGSRVRLGSDQVKAKRFRANRTGKVFNAGVIDADEFAQQFGGAMVLQTKSR